MTGTILYARPGFRTDVWAHRDGRWWSLDASGDWRPRRVPPLVSEMRPLGALTPTGDLPPHDPTEETETP